MVVHFHVLVVIQIFCVCMCAFVSIRHLLTLDGHGAVVCKLGSGHCSNMVMNGSGHEHEYNEIYFSLINFVKGVKIVVDDSIGHCESVPMIGVGDEYVMNKCVIFDLPYVIAGGLQLT